METVHALKTCGAITELLHLNEILRDKQRLFLYSIIVIPGGFSYGDDIAAGKVLANELKFKLGQEMQKFIAEGNLVIGICNGFQVLVKRDSCRYGSGKTNAGRNACAQRFRQVPVRVGGNKKRELKKQWLNDLPAKFELP